MPAVIQGLEPNATQDFGAHGPLGFLRVASGVTSIVGNTLLTAYNWVVNQIDRFILDPPAGQRYQLVEEAGSPTIASIMLPFMTGVSFYSLRALNGDVWANVGNVDAGTLYLFSDGVDGIEVIPLDSEFMTLYLPGGFLFDVSFTGDGTFLGTTEVTNAASAPEPPSFGLVVLVLVGLGFARLRSAGILQIASGLKDHVFGIYGCLKKRLLFLSAVVLVMSRISAESLKPRSSSNS